MLFSALSEHGQFTHMGQSVHSSGAIFVFTIEMHLGKSLQVLGSRPQLYSSPTASTACFSRRVEDRAQCCFEQQDQDARKWWWSGGSHDGNDVWHGHRRRETVVGMIVMMMAMMNEEEGMEDHHDNMLSMQYGGDSGS